MPYSCCVLSVCKKDKADLVFLLDQSSSIYPGNYTIMKNFAQELVNSFDVSEESVHFGLAQFSTKPQHEFYLDKYLKREDVITHIREMNQTGGDTYLGEALNHIKEYFNASRGSRRPNIPQNLVVITDGDSHDDVEDQAEVLKEMGVTAFGIAVGDVHDLQLLQITRTPERLFNVQTFNKLTEIKKKVLDAICDEPVPTGELCVILPQFLCTLLFLIKVLCVCGF